MEKREVRRQDEKSRNQKSRKTEVSMEAEGFLFLLLTAYFWLLTADFY